LRYNAVSGRTDCVLDFPASRLLQVRMNILSYDTCRAHVAAAVAASQHHHDNDDGESYINNSAHICIGSVPTHDAGICNVCRSLVWRTGAYIPVSPWSNIHFPQLIQGEAPQASIMRRRRRRESGE